MGFEPTTPRTTLQMSRFLNSFWKKKKLEISLFFSKPTSRLNLRLLAALKCLKCMNKCLKLLKIEI